MHIIQSLVTEGGSTSCEAVSIRKVSRQGLAGFKQVCMETFEFFLLFVDSVACSVVTVVLDLEEGLEHLLWFICLHVDW